MIVDVKMNLIDLLPPDQLVAAQRVYQLDWSNTWDVNAGVTLWNLKHPLAKTVMKKWKYLSQYGDKANLNNHLLEILSKNDDQQVSPRCFFHRSPYLFCFSDEFSNIPKVFANNTVAI